jgi:hypothetical protein
VSCSRAGQRLPQTRASNPVKEEDQAKGCYHCQPCFLSQRSRGDWHECNGTVTPCNRVLVGAAFLQGVPCFNDFAISSRYTDRHEPPHPPVFTSESSVRHGARIKLTILAALFATLPSGYSRRAGYPQVRNATLGSLIQHEHCSIHAFGPCGSGPEKTAHACRAVGGHPTRRRQRPNAARGPPASRRAGSIYRSIQLNDRKQLPCSESPRRQKPSWHVRSGTLCLRVGHVGSNQETKESGNRMDPRGIGKICCGRHARPYSADPRRKTLWLRRTCWRKVHKPAVECKLWPVRKSNADSWQS